MKPQQGMLFTTECRSQDMVAHFTCVAPAAECVSCRCEAEFSGRHVVYGAALFRHPAGLGVGRANTPHLPAL